MKSNRLYTWTDVQNEIYMELSMGTWPDGLTEARVFWDGLNILAKSGHEEDVVKWLDKIFGSRFKKYQDNILIILEQHKEKSRHLEVIIETEDEEDMEDDSDEPYFRPLIARPIVIRPQYFRNEPPNIPDDHPPIFAFHSFKGGVARTVHAMAFALLAAESKKILLVDADMEAPGITWMLGQRKPKLDISFADMLALIHGEPEDEMDETLELIKDRVRNICLDNMFVMPAFRSSVRLVSLEIRPEHLIKYSDNPYIMTEMLGELGKKLEVGAVVVDLRAGLSEISAGLLLDPRVHRIFVTTLSDQSLTGTCHEIEHIGKLAGQSKDYMPEPSVILSMIPHQIRQDRDKIDVIRMQIKKAFSGFSYRQNSSGKHDDSFRYGDIPIYESPFDQELLVLPKDWDEVLSLIRQSKIMDGIRPLLKNMGSGKGIRTERTISDNADLHEKQKIAIEHINRLLSTQELSAGEFFISEAMKRLASDFSNKVPIAVIRGKKGAGKTSFFNHLVQSKSWKSFSGTDFDFDAEIKPIFIPLGEYAEKIPESEDVSFWKKIWERFEKEDFSKTEWGNSWTDYFAYACGFGYDDETIGDMGDLLESLGDDRKLVFVLDLPAEKDMSDSLRSKFKKLITSVPEWFETHHLRALGLIIFCDSDFLDDLFEKDSLTPFIEPYLPYQLKMTDKDILGYVSYILQGDDILPGYQMFAGYRKKVNKANTPFTILIFLKTLLEILSDEGNNIRTYDAVARAMEKMAREI